MSVILHNTLIVLALFLVSCMLLQSTWASKLDVDKTIIKWDGNLTISQYLFDKNEKTFYFYPKLNKTQVLERLVEEDKIIMFGAQNCEVKVTRTYDIKWFGGYNQ